MLSKPRYVGPFRFLAEIGELTVEPDTPARVVINERTGTVVIGATCEFPPSPSPTAI